MGQLFGTDGIRGEANRYPMNAEIAFATGQAVAHLFRKNGHRAQVIIGKDTRISGYMLESSLEAASRPWVDTPILLACCRPRASPS
jgi:phosphoglucosamine mutase